MQGGLTNNFQMVLGGAFGRGPDWQNRVGVSLNNAFRTGDTFSFIGWNATDLREPTPLWQAGVIYKTPLLKRKNHNLTVSGGVQRWILTTVKCGAKDWVVPGNLTYTTSVKRLPITFSTDSWSLLSSTLPTGSVIYSQIGTQHTLLKRDRFRLMLRQGPCYTYSWNFYGVNGNRVFRYGGTLVGAWKSTTIEAGFRQQFGLQDAVHRSHYMTLLVTRQFNGGFASLFHR